MTKLFYKKLLITAAALLFTSSLTACSSLPSGMDEDKLREASYNVIELLDAGEYNEVFSLLRSDISETTSAEEIQAAFAPMLGEVGEFVEYNRERYKTQTVKESGEKYAHCQITVEYTQGAATFTFGFDSDYALIGVSMITR